MYELISTTTEACYIVDKEMRLVLIQIKVLRILEFISNKLFKQVFFSIRTKSLYLQLCCCGFLAYDNFNIC